MRARLLRIVVGILLLLTGYAVGTHTSTSIHAEQRAIVPASYGRVVAANAGSLWFEDEHGTLRQVNVPQGNMIFSVSRH